MNKFKQGVAALKDKKYQTKKEEVKLEFPSAEQQLEREIKKLSLKKIGGMDVEIKRRLIPNNEIKDTILVDSYNQRHQEFLKNRNVDDLLSDIASNNGVINEPVLCRYDGLHYYAIDGSRRREAAMQGGYDLPIEYFKDELPENIIKAHIRSTTTSKDFSDLEKFLVIKTDLELIEKENIGVSKTRMVELENEVYETHGFSTSRASRSRIKKMLDFIEPNYFLYARVNQISKDQLRKIAEHISKLKSFDAKKYTYNYFVSVFKNIFDELDEELVGDYTGADALKKFKEKEKITIDSTNKSEDMLFIDEDKCKLTYTQNSKGFKLSGACDLPDGFKEELEKLCKQFFLQ